MVSNLDYETFLIFEMLTNLNNRKHKSNLNPFSCDRSFVLFVSLFKIHVNKPEMNFYEINKGVDVKK